MNAIQLRYREQFELRLSAIGLHNFPKECVFYFKFMCPNYGIQNTKAVTKGKAPPPLHTHTKSKFSANYITLKVATTK